MSSVAIIFSRPTICGTLPGKSKMGQHPQKHKPTLKPTFWKRYLRSRDRCCSEKRSYPFKVEWFESFTPGWRNWQTQRTQNPPGFGPWGFDSPSRHQHLQATDSIRDSSLPSKLEPEFI